MSRYDELFSVTKEVELEVSINKADICDNIDFSDLIELYDLNTGEICDSLGTEEVIEWAAAQDEFTSPAVAEVIAGNTELVGLVLEVVRRDYPELIASAAPPTVLALSSHGSGLFKTATVNESQNVIAVYAGGEMAVKVTHAVGEPEIIHFHCENEGQAFHIVRALMAQEVRS